MTMDSGEYVQYLMASGEPLEGLLTVFLCEVHNQMTDQLDTPHEGTAPVGVGMVRKPVSGIDVAAIARVIEECIPDSITGARLLTLALLNMIGAVEW